MPALAAAKAVPQSPQNRCPAGFPALQAGQSIGHSSARNLATETRRSVNERCGVKKHECERPANREGSRRGSQNRRSFISDRRELELVQRWLMSTMCKLIATGAKRRRTPKIVRRDVQDLDVSVVPVTVGAGPCQRAESERGRLDRRRRKATRSGRATSLEADIEVNVRCLASRPREAPQRDRLTSAGERACTASLTLWG